MSYAISNYALGKQKRKHRRQKMKGSAKLQSTPIKKKVTMSAKTAQVSMTVVDAQRQNREAAKKWKTSVRKFAIGLSIGLHAVAIVIAAVYIVRKTVLHMNEDKVQSVVVNQAKPQPKRRTPPRATRRTEKPKTFKIRAPKGKPVTTHAKIPMGNARFTLPTGDISTRPTTVPSTTGIGKNLLTIARQTHIVNTMPKFEVPKFQTASFVERMDVGTSLAQSEFNDPGNIELASINLGDAKQSFNEFLKLVRERIKRAQRFPPSVRNLEEGSTTTVRFTLFKDGTVGNPKVANSSGSRALDSAAIAAVQNAVPYPPFPDGQYGSSLRLELPIVFELVN